MNVNLKDLRMMEKFELNYTEMLIYCFIRDNVEVTTVYDKEKDKSVNIIGCLVDTLVLTEYFGEKVNIQKSLTHLQDKGLIEIKWYQLDRYVKVKRRVMNARVGAVNAREGTIDERVGVVKDERVKDESVDLNVKSEYYNSDLSYHDSDSSYHYSETNSTMENELRKIQKGVQEGRLKIVEYASWLPFRNHRGYQCSKCYARVRNPDVEKGTHRYCYKCGSEMRGVWNDCEGRLGRWKL